MESTGIWEHTVPDGNLTNAPYALKHISSCIWRIRFRHLRNALLSVVVAADRNSFQEDYMANGKGSYVPDDFDAVEIDLLDEILKLDPVRRRRIIGAVEAYELVMGSSESREKTGGAPDTD